MLIDFREGNGGKEIGRETSIGYLSYTPLLGSVPATQACTLTGNWTSKFLVYGTKLLTNWATLARAKVSYF